MKHYFFKRVVIAHFVIAAEIRSEALAKIKEDPLSHKLPQVDVKWDCEGYRDDSVGIEAKIITEE